MTTSANLSVTGMTTRRNTHGKHPRQSPMANTHGKHPRQTLAANTHSKHPRQTPTANTHGKHPPTANKHPQQTPTANTHPRQTPTANTHPRQTPTHSKHPPTANTHGKHPRLKLESNPGLSPWRWMVATRPTGISWLGLIQVQFSSSHLKQVSQQSESRSTEKIIKAQ